MVKLINVGAWYPIIKRYNCIIKELDYTKAIIITLFILFKKALLADITHQRRKELYKKLLKKNYTFYTLISYLNRFEKYR